MTTNRTSLGNAHTQLNKIEASHLEADSSGPLHICANADQLVPWVMINKNDVESSFGCFLAKSDNSVSNHPPRSVMSSPHMDGIQTWQVHDWLYNLSSNLL